MERFSPAEGFRFNTGMCTHPCINQAFVELVEALASCADVSYSRPSRYNSWPYSSCGLDKPTIVNETPHTWYAERSPYGAWPFSMIDYGLTGLTGDTSATKPCGNDTCLANAAAMGLTEESELLEEETKEEHKKGDDLISLITEASATQTEAKVKNGGILEG